MLLSLPMLWVSCQSLWNFRGIGWGWPRKDARSGRKVGRVGVYGLYAKLPKRVELSEPRCLKECEKFRPVQSTVNTPKCPGPMSCGAVALGVYTCWTCLDSGRSWV